jgi:uncharacterized membrane protein
MIGNELGGGVAFQPALARLPPATQIEATQALTRRYLWLMPLWLSASLGSYIPVLRYISRRRGRPFWATLASLGCLLAMLGVTLACNLPLDRRMLQFQPDMPLSAWHALRARWARWHAVRNLLNLAALVLLYSGVLMEVRDANEAQEV